MLVKIKFTKTGCCSAIGNFGPGDVATIGEDMASHLVNDAKVAEYAAPKIAAEIVEAIEPQVIHKKKKQKG